MEQFNVDKFFRELYLRSEPSLDITTVKGPINPADYRLRISELEKIEKEFDIQKGTDLSVSVSMLILNKGPQLVNDFESYTL